MNIIKRTSPNFNQRPSNKIIDTVILHYTGMLSAEAAINRMCDPQSNVSCHYCVDEDGNIFQLVEDEMRAWHAGVSHWKGVSGLNDNSIGIEIVNPGHEFGYRNFPELQMQAVIELLKHLTEKHKIDSRYILGHSDIAPDRKEDPGELFDWKRLYDNNLSIWHGLPQDYFNTPSSLIEFQSADDRIKQIQADLKAFGYPIIETGIFDEQTRLVITAFYRRFVPQRILSCENKRYPEKIFWDEKASSALSKLLAVTSS